MANPFTLPEEEPDHSKDRPRILALAILLAVVIFVLDSFIPLGVAEAVPYVAVVLVVLRSPHPRDPIYAAVGCSILTLLGFFLSPKGSALWIAEINRGLALFAIWATAILASQIKSTDAAVRAKGQILSGILRNMPAVAFRLGEEGYLKESVGKGLNRIGITGYESYGRNALEPPADLKEKVLSAKPGDPPLFYESSGSYRGKPWWFMNWVIPDPEHGDNVIGFGLDITHFKQAERRLATHHAVTSVLVEAASISEAYRKILQAICESLHWSIGAIWEIDHQAQVLRCVEIWHQPSLRLDSFIAQTHGLTFGPGVGLPGRVWKQGEPAWIVDVAQDANFPRASAANQEGLHGGFAFPVQLGTQVLSVIEFFTQEVIEPDQELLTMFAAFGRQLGQFIERKHKARRLAVHNAVASVLVEATSLDKAKGQILEAICMALDWEVGLLWEVDPDINAMRCTETWHAPTIGIESVIAQARTLSLLPGMGLAGQVLKKGEPSGLVDVAHKIDHPLGQAIMAKGLHGGFAFPIRAGSRVLSVMEFYSRDTLDTDEELLNMFTAIGIQIGLFIAHYRMEESLRATEERERLVLNSIEEALFGIDQQGRFTFCNAACLRILGYRDPTSLIGKKAHALLHPMHQDGSPYPIEDCQLCQAMLRGEVKHTADERFFDAHQNSIPVECRTRPILRDNRVIGCVVTMKRLEEAEERR